MPYAIETFDFTHNGRDFVAKVYVDDHHGAPWEEEDGHGPVTGWERRDKRPGELILAEDGRAKLFYDFAEACRIARRDGWGFMPYKLRIYRDCDFGGPATSLGGRVEAGPYVATDPENFNRAIGAVYAQHRATMTPRQYAASAVMEDFKRMRAYAQGDWCYVGIVVRPAEACECCGPSQSLWGIESDSPDYLREVATELAEEFCDVAAAA